MLHRPDAGAKDRLRVPELGGVMSGITADEQRLVASMQEAVAQALRADPADVGALLDGARRLLWLGYWPFAENAATQVLAIAPNDAAANALLAAVRAEQGRLAEARALASEALRRDPTASSARIVDAHARAMRGARSEAITTLRDVADHDPDQPAAAFLLGTLLADTGQFAAATPWLARARTFLPASGIGKGEYVATVAAFADLLGGRTPYRNSGTADVPMQRLPLPAVAVTLSGRGRTLPGLCVIDCGASLTVLGPAAAALARESTAQASMLTVAGKSGNVAGLLERLAIGGLVLDDVPVLVNHGEQAPHAPGVIGTIGIGLLRNFRVTIDPSAGRFRLDSPHVASEPQAAAEVPFELVHNTIVVQGSGGPERPFVFDSGANNLFVSPRVLGQEFGALPGRPRTQVAFGGAETQTVEVPLPRPFVFGARDLPQPTAIADPSIDMRNAYLRFECAGTLGLVVRARYVLDFERQRLLLYDR
ncbi:MAG: aspartyl protease family protein [Planctomycetota bacterium]